MKSLKLVSYRDLQSVLEGRGQGGDPRGALHGRQHLSAVWFESCENQRICFQNLRLLDQDLGEENTKGQCETFICSQAVQK